MGYQHIIFDFSGTLVDSSDVTHSILNEMLDKSAFKGLSAKDFLDTKSLPLSKRIRVVVYTALHQREFVELYGKYVEQLKLFDGIKPMLALLHDKGLEFSIISSNSAEMITSFFRLHGISVKAVYSSKRLFGKKKAIRQYIRDHKCMTSDIVYVGDEKRDVEMCSKCGVAVIFVGWGVGALDDASRHKVLRIVETPDELAAFLVEAPAGSPAGNPVG